MAKKNHNKEELRILYKDAIIHTDRRTKVSEIKRILNLLTNREEYTEAEVIAFYWPMDTELDTIPMIDFSLFHGKRVVIPFITSDKAMEFKEIETVEFERIKKYGIIQPTESHPTIDRDEIDLFVIPAVAFNKKGHRVGSGKGYYDRYLEGLEDPICILLSLSGREHNFKSELHDIASNIIITEKRLIRIHESGYHLNDKDELIIPTLQGDFDPMPMTDGDEKHEGKGEEEKATDDKVENPNENIDDKPKDMKKQKELDGKDDESKEEDDILDELIDDENKKSVDEATKNALSVETSLIKTMSAMGTTRKELNKKRKAEAKEIKKKLKEQKDEAKRIAKEVEDDGVEDELRKKLEDDDKKKKNDLSDIPDADKLLAILESKDTKPKKQKKEKVKKEKIKKVKPKKDKKKKSKNK